MAVLGRKRGVTNVVEQRERLPRSLGMGRGALAPALERGSIARRRSRTQTDCPLDGFVVERVVADSEAVEHRGVAGGCAERGVVYL